MSEDAAKLLIWVFLGGLIYSLPTLCLCWLLMAIAPKDAPDGARKTQAIAIPTSGGLAIGFVFLFWIIIGYIFDDIINSECRPARAFSCLPVTERFAQLQIWPHIFLWFGVLGLGALDDATTLPTKLKFACLGFMALLAASFGAHVDGIFLPIADSYLPIPLWLGLSGTALWIFVFVNASNFMDGSNGIAMGTLAIMIGGISLALPVDMHDLTSMAGTIIFAILGFLFWNLQGKLYAGDAGSLFGGAVFASLGIYAAQDGNIWLPATLALPFLVDVFMTLLWRAKRKHNLLTPHRHHAYQLLIKSGWGHIKTALLWWSFALVCASAALWAVSQSISVSAFVFLGMLGLGCTLWIIQRMRTPEAVKTG